MRREPDFRPLIRGDLELWGILARGLEKDREQRFPTMRALGRELAKYLLDRRVKTASSTNHRANPKRH